VDTVEKAGFAVSDSVDNSTFVVVGESVPCYDSLHSRGEHRVLDTLERHRSEPNIDRSSPDSTL